MDPTDKKQVILVACCGPKVAEKVRAADLYISALFKKARIYAERRGPWFILSALHGLVNPDDLIAPYDLTLKKMPAQKRREWGLKVREQMERAGIVDLSLVSLAGNDYVKPLIDAGLKVTQTDERTRDWQTTSMARPAKCAGSLHGWPRIAQNVMSIHIVARYCVASSWHFSLKDPVSMNTRGTRPKSKTRNR